MRADVVIVGAGLAGLQCARQLTRRGVNVVLADRKPAVGERIHTTGILVRKTLEDFALPEDCLGPIVRTVRLISPAGRTLEIASDRDEFRVGRMASLYEHMLAGFLHAGGRYLPGTRYLHAHPAPGGSIVHLSREGAPFNVGCRLLIGADGARSRVAPDLGLDQNHEWIVGVEDVLPARPLDGPPRFDCYLDPRIAPGYLAWAVNDGQEMHIGVGGYAAHFNAAAALEQFRDRVGIDAANEPIVEHRGGLIPVNGILRRIANERGLLIGDAAGAVSPLTAGGLDPAIRLSTLAADVAVEVLAGNTAALARYRGDQFSSRFISRRWMRKAIAAIRSPRLMELTCAAIRTWPMRRLANHIFFGRGSFPDVQVLPLHQQAIE
ncbi:MAG: NAD(P)/FAD-dependent oxidoreductase [Phycisphaerales bacterium]|nr:NAD(P)/FAD-dependent oxidoreductase [Phycisphaerales bacterium]